ncbi:hypothetical protein [Streptomyces sp. V4I2]|jgi:hypothetical protein|uniref:hypothetical protein n=1 Tax=Streptomyces sp. V4I2 TaxID=3042280 RepID=UPI00278B2D6B|nr:hypothetical protein [Streptomyces sp. V4I2]MDQ1042072.1 energy-converting hydrogenase Eha subunit A [Streptomyces sp. V4I2]
MPATTRAYGIPRRAATVTAGLSALVHVTMLTQHTGALALVLLVLAMACLGCAVMLPRSPGRREWTVMAVLGATMVIAHLAWPSSRPMADHMNDIHGQGGGDTAMHLALVLAAAETLLALIGLLVPVRARYASRTRAGHLTQEPIH